MSSQTGSLIVLATWGALLALYLASRLLTQDRVEARAPRVHRPSATEKPGTLASKSGTLLVFLMNIASLAMLFAAALSPAIKSGLTAMRVDLPYWVSIAGSVLFVAGMLFGYFAMTHNPSYTPLFMAPPASFPLATGGPYSAIRHPRYATEAFLNLALFAFTGYWLSLLGILGWPLMYQQARAEEQYLLKLVPDAYSAYRVRTGMFFPRMPDRSKRG